ncbi:hypothetical protein GWK48_08955 [Metallosphaera tengchongensis]|uniref:DUF5751 domain-containing protein n=1 Tax=Metallosphaera tengchongensis TaxID=1532350 RepID=A0A6N0NX88_9CREN|nr:DUF5751 family protein [Metallosphaera tengchongensis]QKR00483.1 hypothetical protein GWK48_08955 [Metallosphaera tengchongensis]
MEVRNKSLLVFVGAREDTLADLFRKIMKDARTSGFRKIVIDVISDSPHWQVLASVREAILDNIDLGLEVYTWKAEEADRMLKKAEEIRPDGVMTYCDEDNKFFMSRLLSNLSEKLKINIVRDNCK